MRDRLKRAKKFVTKGTEEEEGEGDGESVSEPTCVIHHEEGKRKGKDKERESFILKILKIYDFFVQMKIKYNIFYKNFMFVRVFRCF